MPTTLHRELEQFAARALPPKIPDAYRRVIRLAFVAGFEAMLRVADDLDNGEAVRAREALDREAKQFYLDFAAGRE